MNKKFFLSLILFSLLSINAVLASPEIDNLFVDPFSLWFGEDVSITLDCFDNENKSIESVYADIEGPGIILPKLYFSNSGGSYELVVSSVYLDRTGEFNVVVSCENNESEIITELVSFTISKLTGYIKSIEPSPAYIDDVIEIDFVVKKDNSPLSSDVIFNISLDGFVKPLKYLPVYDTTKGWILRIDSPSFDDLYDLEVKAFYDRTTVSNFSTLDIRNEIEYEIVSVNKEWVDIDDELIITLRALERGSVISLNENNTAISIGSVESEILDVSYHSGVFDVKVDVPNISPGNYKLKAVLNYAGSHSDETDISYIVPIEGELVDENDKPLSVKMEFIQDGVIKLSFITDAFGKYSKLLPPGTYDLEITFPQSKLYLYSVLINGFNDPIKYTYSTSEVPGINVAGLHDFGIGFSYSSVEMELEYNEKNIEDETELRIFTCDNWNSGKKKCNEDLEEIGGDIDVVRNLIELSSSEFSAFIIGTIKNLNIIFNFDRKIYNIGDKVEISGLVKDVDGKNVGNATIDIVVKNTDIDFTIDVDENGVFSASFDAPLEEDEYKVVLTAHRDPYVSSKSQKTFKVSKSKVIYVDMPDTITLERGKNYTKQFSLINTGQADLNNLSLSLVGLSEEYYELTSTINKIKAGGEVDFDIIFYIPSYAELGISGLTLEIVGEEFRQEKVFGYSIIEPVDEEEIETSPTTGFLTGIPIPQFTLDLISGVLLLSIVVVSVLIIRKKFVKKNRREIKDILFDVKDYIKKRKVNIKSDVVSKIEGYDELINSQFPGILEKYTNLISSRFPPDDLKKIRDGDK